jgi:hypothetical protein
MYWYIYANSKAFPEANIPAYNQHNEPNEKYNQPKKSNDRRKNLHNQHLHKQRRIRSIRKSSTTPHDAHTDTTRQITQSDRQPRPEECIAREIVAFGV